MAKESYGQKRIQLHMEAIGAGRLATVEAPDGGTLTFWNTGQRVYIVQEFAGKRGHEIYRAIDCMDWTSLLAEVK